MANSYLQITLRRAIVLTSSAVVLLLAAISLASAIDIRAPNRFFAQTFSTQNTTIEVHAGQAVAKVPSNGTRTGDKCEVSGSLVPGSMTTRPTSDGQVAAEATSAALSDAPTSIIDMAAVSPTMSPNPPLQIPILALSYSSSGGPKHCRGTLLQKARFERPVVDWENGTCITLPQDARCGVFLAAKEDNCEAHLFNQEQCVNTTQTYVNTVVFMPEERAVGALWRSMLVKCGVDVPEAKMLDPSILGGLLKKPGNGKGSRRLRR